MSRRQHTFLVPFVCFRCLLEVREGLGCLLGQEPRLIIGDLISFAIAIGPAIVAVLPIAKLHEGLAYLPADNLEGGVEGTLHTLFPGLLPQIFVLQLESNFILGMFWPLFRNWLILVEGEWCITGSYS